MFSHSFFFLKMSSHELSETVDVLSAADPRHGNHRQALTRLQQLQQQPSFYGCCATIFADQTMTPFVRMQSGFQLKNNITNPVCIQNEVVRTNVTRALGDPDASIRKNASSVVSAAVRNGAWSVAVVVPQLVTMLQEAGFTNPAQAHGSVVALSHVVEDAVEALDAANYSSHVINALCPCVMYEGNEKIRLNALIALTVFLEQAGIHAKGASYNALHPVILQLMECFLQNLQSPMSADISEQSIKCLVLSLTFHEQITPDLFLRVAQIMLQATQVDPDTMEAVRIEAVQFWQAVLLFPNFAEIIFPALGQIVPLLVDGMVYSRMELGMLQANAEDASVPDRLEDLKPRHYEARTQETAEDDENDDDSDEVEDFNLRRVSAGTLDDIAEYFGDRVLDSVLSVIDQRMQPSQDWRSLEAAVLALGAIGEGCYEGLKPYLEQITNRLLDLLENPSTHFLVVTIATWALRRVAQFLLNNSDGSDGRPQLRRYMACVLKHMQAPSKLVQEAACCALTDVCDQAEDGQVDGYLPAIAQTVNACLAGYQLKNRVLLFEQIGSLCNRFQQQMADPEIMPLFINPLVTIWQSTPNDSPLLFSFFTCMSSVCGAVGPHIQSMAKDIFDRAYGVYSYHMNLRLEAQRTGAEAPEFEYVVTSVDLLSGLFDALGSSLEPLVQANCPAIMQVTLAAIVDPLHEIRQSGFALLGDFAKSCPRYAQEAIPQIVAAIGQNCQGVDDVTAGCVSNAAWLLQGLLDHQMDIDGLPLLQGATLIAATTPLLRILAQETLSADMKNMAENIAIFVGSAMNTDPNLLNGMGVTLDLFLRRWLDYARHIRKGEGRFNAARGMLLAIQQNPAVLVGKVAVFLDYSSTLIQAPDDIKKAVTGIFTAISQGAQAEWSKATREYSAQLLNKLYVAFGVR
ncbi:protein tyrosine kinase, putative [Bodo saltans]|uniref:Protein tyrosine kinase, putative n=1 Tax=Bodo saltans TaxID=75058 RepID=A0A0S4J991_BODSA|nr:protein tyrosine kinase, putative [Bodo saltans]|eukprot:CUG88076.1 protein tyrosine kinase, putative [Bodo saltans]